MAEQAAAHRVHTPESSPFAAMPLQGIGTGGPAIAADGGLRQWQLHHTGNHQGSLPHSFLAVRVTRWEPPLDTVRLLQGVPSTDHPPTPLVDDDAVPDWLTALLGRVPGFSRAEFTATYPEATVRLSDPDVPLVAEIRAFNPMVPLDVETSSIPVVMLTVTLTSTDTLPLHGVLGLAQQNPVGGDGISPIDGVHGAGYGGNVNRTERRRGWTSLVMENVALPETHPGQGQFVVAVDHPSAAVLPQWRTPQEWLTFLQAHALADGSWRLRTAPGQSAPQQHAPSPVVGPSPLGSTWNGGIAVPFQLEPGGSTTVRLLLGWSFPNRYVSTEQFGPPRPEWGASTFWLGDHHTLRYPDARSVRDDVTARWDELVSATRGWTDVLTGSDLDPVEREHLAAQASLVRSPTCFRAADGTLLGYEGTLGASTVMWSGRYGGSCPMNCTHVWNYEHALARLWPELEKSMRDTEFDVMQAPGGALPHRLVVPTYLRQLWDEPIGGPEEPALDGMLGALLKTYREHRADPDDGWLQRRWERVLRLLAHVRGRWCEERTGLLVGIQPSTHDIDLAGVNSYTGTFWLAALRAVEEMARRLGDDAVAADVRAVFTLASASYDEQLWNGEYYQQVLREGDPVRFQWLTGCLSDQLIGQWWAHQLDLGHLLPVDRVRTALRSVVRCNLRRGFDGFEHPFRVFADGDDTGLLMCSWPRGGRPEVPTRYADEVWTGIEHQVAAHCLWEGLDEQAGAVLGGLRGRYDGSRRNPWNEIECGDHYARAMAGWTVLEAMTGVRHDAARQVVALRPQPGRARTLPVLLATGWGHVTTAADEVVLTLRSGRLSLREVRLDDADGRRCGSWQGERELRPGDELVVGRTAPDVESAV